MIRIAIEEEVRDLGIDNPAACLITSVRVCPAPDSLEEDIARCLDTVCHHSDTILDRPEVRGFETLAARLGYPSALPAGHHRIQLLQRRGFRSHNNLVDAYNLASVEFGSSVGMHDVGRLGTFNVQIFRASGDEMIKPLFKAQPVPVPAGSVVYGPDRSRMFAALGNIGADSNDVDSDDFKVTETTETVLLVALGNSETSEAYNHALCDRVLELLRHTCPEATASFLEVSAPAQLLAMT